MPTPHQLSTERVFSGRVFSVDRDSVRFPDGSSGTLDMIRHPGAAAIVPLLSSDDSADPQVLLIRQFRYAAGGPIWEVPAGTLSAGEDPQVCARRELEEETGATATRLDRLTSIYTTPGFTDEVIHLFVARGLTSGQPRPDADEFIEVRAFPMSEVLRMVRDGEIVDGKSICAILYVAGFQLGM
jgi:ADP-ribose diphosphatase